MRFLCPAILLVMLGCHKGTNTAGPSRVGSASTGSATAGGTTEGSAAAGSAAAGSAAAGSAAAGSAAAGSTAANSATAAPEMIAALDDMDRRLAPVMKLDVHPRFVALVKLQPELRKEWEAIKTMKPPPGVAEATWSQAVDNLGDQVGGLGMCAQDFKPAWYAKASKAMKQAADESYQECIKDLPDAFAAVVKLVPGANPPGTHASDPVMSPAK